MANNDIAVEYEYRTKEGIITTTKKIPFGAEGKEADWIEKHNSIKPIKIIRVYTIK